MNKNNKATYMANGVTFSDVDAAARYLQGMGKTPTLDALREHLGRGSRTTLLAHLQRWKAEQTDTTDKLPDALLALVTGLWKQLQITADERIRAHQQEANQEIEALKLDYQRELELKSQLTHSLEHVQEKLQQEQQFSTELREQLQLAEKSRDTLEATHHALLQQLESAKEDNDKLHQLAKQVQANLEHYQQAIQQQTLEQNLTKEKQHAAFAQEIAALKAELHKVNDGYHQSEKNLFAKDYAFQQLQEQLNHKLIEFERLSTHSQTSEHKTIELQTENTLLKKQIEKFERDVLSTQHTFQSQQQQMAILTDKLQQVQIQLQKTEDSIETLRQEKLSLVQEKAKLEGILKQSQNKVSI